MKRKILIIANPNSIWTKTYIENVLVNEAFEVYLLGYGEINKDFLAFYETSGVHFVFGSCSTNKVRRLIEIFKVKYVVKPDFIHVMYVAINACKMADLMLRKGCKLILSYMGSDIYRVADGDRLNATRFLEKAYAITFPSDKAYDEFKRSFAISNSRLYDAEFGDQVLDYISEVSLQEKQTFRSYFGIEKDKYVICIGYNGNSNQNHIRVLEQFNSLPIETKHNVYILLHVSYGLQDEQYLVMLKDAAEKTSCSYCINTDFLTYQEMAKFRQCADCYINAQSTDDYSVSLIEYLYAGCTVINAKWLKYDRLTRIGITFYEFDDYDEIPTLIKKVVSNVWNCHSVSVNGASLVKHDLEQLYSWTVCKGMWMNVYNGKGIKFRED